MIGYKLRNFMRGRYGIDQLGKALFILYIALSVLNILIRSQILTVVSLLISIIFAYRFFSRKIYVRQKENRVYLSLFSKFKAKFFDFKKKFSVFFRRIKERKHFKYRSCPHCSATLRFPNKKGSHALKCPKCGGVINVKI